MTTLAQAKPGDGQTTSAPQGAVAAKAQGIAKTAYCRLDASLLAAVNEIRSWQQWVVRKQIE